MTIRAHHSRLIWPPLIGWALMSCGLTAAHAQTSSPAASDMGTGGTGFGTGPTTDTPAPVPAGGAVPAIVLPTSPTQPYGAPKPDDPNATTPQANQTVRTLAVPSSGSTIVDAPFGTSVPYYGGITSTFANSGTAGGGGAGASDAVGITLGSFTLIPQIEINVGYDNNVFAQSASAGTTASMYTTVTPSIDLKSDWTNHMIHVVASGTYGYYAIAPTQNYQNYGILVDGKIDIHSDIYATWGIGFKRATEALGTPNTAFAQAPTVVDTVPVQIGLYQEFNDVFYQIGAQAIRYWHYDNSTITSVGLPGASRDRFEFAETLRVGYHINEDLDLFVEPSASQVRYIQYINAAGQQRDSDGLSMNAGATWRPNAVSVLEGTVGYQLKNYPSLGSDSGLSFGLKGSWTGYAPLTLRPTITRTITESALSNYKNVTSTIFAVDYTYVIHDGWTLAGGLLYSISDYSPIDGAGVAARTDYFMRGQIGLLYSIRPEVQIGPFFEYTHGTSTDSTGPAYDRQIFSIRLVAKR